MSINLSSLKLSQHYLYAFSRYQDFRSFSLPCDFPAWDKNGDGYINKQEFSTVADFAVEKGELALAFQATDTDGLSTHQ